MGWVERVIQNGRIVDGDDQFLMDAIPIVVMRQLAVPQRIGRIRMARLQRRARNPKLAQSQGRTLAHPQPIRAADPTAPAASSVCGAGSWPGPFTTLAYQVRPLNRTRPRTPTTEIRIDHQNAQAKPGEAPPTDRTASKTMRASMITAV